VLVRAVRAALPADVPVLAGTGAPSARQAAGLTTSAVRAGADAVLAFPPPGSRDLAGYYGAVAAAAAGRPVLAYHFPQVSAPGIAVEALAGLPVAGLKDSSGDPDRLLDELAHYAGATYIEPEACMAAFGGGAAAQRGLAGPHLAVKRGGPRALKAVLARTHGTGPWTRD